MAKINGRAKGLAYEAFIASKFRLVGFPDAKRHLEYQFQEALGRDLDGTQPFSVQCKCKASEVSMKVLDEVTIDDEYIFRIAIVKKTRSAGKPGREVVVMDADLFFKLLGAITHIFEELEINFWDIANQIRTDIFRK